MEYAAAFVLGTIVGSFINVVVYRLPSVAAAGIRPNATRSLAFLAAPLSFCPHCATPIKPWNNIPLVSYLLLRGKTACCGKSISARYPVLELLGGLAAAACLYRFGPSWQALAAVLMCALLLAIAWIDWETFRLPDILINALLWLGLFVNTAGSFAPLADAVYAAIGGYLALMGIAAAVKLATGKQMLGEGDPKLIAAIGAWLGTVPLVGAVVVGCAAGSVYGLANWLLRGRRKRHLFFPLGPFLAAGAFIMLMVGKEVAAFYFG